MSHHCRVCRYTKCHKGTARRKVAQLLGVHATAVAPKGAKTRPNLGFTNKEKVNGGSNKIFSLVIIIGIHGNDVARCIIDEGNLMDILYQDAFEKLGLKKVDLKSYDGTGLQGFNETSTHP